MADAGGMMTLPTNEELDGWLTEIGLVGTGGLPASWMLANDRHIRRLIAAARLARALAAECGAWRNDPELAGYESAATRNARSTTDALLSSLNITLEGITR